MVDRVDGTWFEAERLGDKSRHRCRVQSLIQLPMPFALPASPTPVPDPMSRGLINALLVSLSYQPLFRYPGCMAAWRTIHTLWISSSLRVVVARWYIKFVSRAMGPDSMSTKLGRGKIRLAAELGISFKHSES